jgi:NAD(P)-dependent dehydrogenase (short-subunit alcohol dehydrogenase family)
MFRVNESRQMRPLIELISLKGKLALITGAASGIGKAIANRFGEAGARLELVDVNEALLNTITHELTCHGIQARSHVVDLAQKETIDRLWIEHLPKPPDILVNNAGIYPFKKFVEIDEAFLEHVMHVNFSSVFWMCQHMIQQRTGRGGIIINIGSIEALLPFKEELTHYNSSKGGVIALTRALAKDYGNAGFKINAIIPGGIMTTGTKNAAKKILKLNLGLIKSGIDFKNRLPIGRFGSPDEVALMAIVLATDLSSYVHGSLIPVDGGFLSA